VENPTAEWITAWSGVAVAGVAFLGFQATVIAILVTSAQTKDRQQLEVEGYLRVDIGPPGGTEDYTPPESVVFTERRYLKSIGDVSEQDPIISVWYRNLQTAPLGFVLGVFARISAEIVDLEGRIYNVELTHQLPYVEPGRSVRMDFVQFPRSWQASARIEAVKYRSLHWDGATPKHGRQQCEYSDGKFRMIPWSDPIDSWRDKFARLLDRVHGSKQERP